MVPLDSGGCRRSGGGELAQARQEERGLLGPAVGEIDLLLALTPGLGAVPRKVPRLVAVVALDFRHVTAAAATAGPARAAGILRRTRVVPPSLILSAAVVLPAAAAAAGALAALARLLARLPLLLSEVQLPTALARRGRGAALLGGPEPPDQLLNRDRTHVQESFDRDSDLRVSGGNNTQELLYDAYLLDIVAERAQLVDEAGDAHAEGVEGLAVVEGDLLEFRAESLRGGLTLMTLIVSQAALAVSLTTRTPSISGGTARRRTPSADLSSRTCCALPSIASQSPQDSR